MKLWIESASQVWPAGDAATAGAVSILTTEDQFVAAVVGRQEAGVRGQESGVSTNLTQQVTAGLASGASMDRVVADVLAALPAGEHVAAALLRIGRDGRAELTEIDVPPLFMARKGDFILLPVTEEELAGRLVRRCDFTVQAGDHLALVSEGFIQARGGGRPWSWRDVAVSIRRLTSTGCDAEQLAGALVRVANQRINESANQRINESANQRINESANQRINESTNQRISESAGARGFRHSPFAILAMFVRPMRTATVWSGPPADRQRDREALARLMAEEGARVICGDTTVEIAARLLGAKLVMAPRPAEGWTEVPPTSHLIGTDERVDLITEGAVTLGVARGRLAEARQPRDLAGRTDGASRLAKLLLEADKITFVEGQAVNPAQRTADGAPLRRAAVAALVEALRARGKIVSAEFF